MPASFPGVQTKRDDFVVDIDEAPLRERMADYFDASIADDEMARRCPRALEETARFPARDTRRYLIDRGIIGDNFLPYLYRPFDARWVYWEPETRLLGEKSPAYPPHAFRGNLWLSAGQRSRKGDFYQPQVTGLLADHHLVESNVQMVPLYLASNAVKATLFDADVESHRLANLGAGAKALCDKWHVTPEDVFLTVVGL
ncbi:MAG TPA: type ISP restriction/modification enzyme, partial [Thermoleophilia bacterium]|nr:type ISP restriction/modification enzyme [Thermoleophilia bacterium]